jgi:hypothetical protein
VHDFAMSKHDDVETQTILDAMFSCIKVAEEHVDDHIFIEMIWDEFVEIYGEFWKKLDELNKLANGGLELVEDYFFESFGTIALPAETAFVVMSIPEQKECISRDNS